MYYFLALIKQYIVPLLFIIVLFLIGYVSIFIFGADNCIEEGSEHVLKDKFGIDVEFSKEDGGKKWKLPLKENTELRR